MSFCLDIDLASPGENGSVVEYQEKIDLAKYPKFHQAIKNIIESKTNYENNQFNKDYYVKLMALKILTIIDQDIKKPEQLSNQLNHHKVKLFKDAFDYNRPQRENNDFVNEKPEVAMIDQNTESYRLMANAYNIYLAAINKLEEIETDNYLQVETDNDKFNYNQSNDVYESSFINLSSSQQALLKQPILISNHEILPKLLHDNQIYEFKNMQWINKQDQILELKHNDQFKLILEQKPTCNQTYTLKFDANFKDAFVYQAPVIANKPMQNLAMDYIYSLDQDQQVQLNLNYQVEKEETTPPGDESENENTNNNDTNELENTENYENKTINIVDNNQKVNKNNQIKDTNKVLQKLPSTGSFLLVFATGFVIFSFVLIHRYYKS